MNTEYNRKEGNISQGNSSSSSQAQGQSRGDNIPSKPLEFTTINKDLNGQLIVKYVLVCICGMCLM